MRWVSLIKKTHWEVMLNSRCGISLSLSVPFDTRLYYQDFNILINNFTGRWYRTWTQSHTFGAGGVLFSGRSFVSLIMNIVIHIYLITVCKYRLCCFFTVVQAARLQWKSSSTHKYIMYIHYKWIFENPCFNLKRETDTVSHRNP